jgi:hypothetical protein
LERQPVIERQVTARRPGDSGLSAVLAVVPRPLDKAGETAAFHRLEHKSNAAMRYNHRASASHLPLHRSRTSRPTEDGDKPMKTMILAAFAALTMSAAVVPAANAALFHNNSTVADDAAATQMQQQGAYNE